MNLRRCCSGSRAAVRRRLAIGAGRGGIPVCLLWMLQIHVRHTGTPAALTPPPVRGRRGNAPDPARPRRRARPSWFPTAGTAGATLRRSPRRRRAPRAITVWSASANVVAERSRSRSASSARVTLDQQQHATFPGSSARPRRDVARRPRRRGTLFSYHLAGYQIVVDEWLVVADGIATVLSCGSDRGASRSIRRRARGDRRHARPAVRAPQAEVSTEALPDAEPPERPIEAAPRGDEQELSLAVRSTRACRAWS